MSEYLPYCRESSHFLDCFESMFSPFSTRPVVWRVGTHYHVSQIPHSSGSILDSNLRTSVAHAPTLHVLSVPYSSRRRPKYVLARDTPV